MGKPSPKTTMTLNKQVIVWARGNLMKTVGKGECWDLAEEALKKAGAKTSNDLGEVKKDSDYVWGTLKDVKDVDPGDILQFRDHEVTITTYTKVTFPDGSWTEETQTETKMRGHHTAIVNSKVDRNGVILTLEQHVKPLGKVVQSKTLHTRGYTTEATANKRMKNRYTKKLDNAKVFTKTTIKVKGKIWAYKPKSKQ